MAQTSTTAQTATAGKIDATLRRVFEDHMGETTTLDLHEQGNRKRVQIEGQIASVTGAGVLMNEVHGRTLVAYRDIFAHHVEVQSPSSLADAVHRALVGLGIEERQHPLKGVPVLPVAKSHGGYHRIKTLVS